MFAPVRGPRWNYAITFGTEKLEWCGNPVVKNFGRYVSSFRQSTRTWRTGGRTDRQTDGRTQHEGIEARLCIASRGKNTIMAYYE